MKKTSKFLLALAALLCNAMCAVVAFNWASQHCAILHGGASAPEWVIFYLAIPFLLPIAACIIAVILLERKKK